MSSHLSCDGRHHIVATSADSGRGGRTTALVAALVLSVAAVSWQAGVIPGRLTDKLGLSSEIAANSPKLDLSKPIFVNGALCPNQGLLALYSKADSQGCLVADTRSPVSVVALVTNDQQVQVLKIDADTPEGTIEGWVRADSLRN